MGPNWFSLGAVLVHSWYNLGTKISGDTVCVQSLCSICEVLCSVIQVRLLKLESEVERERKKLAELRRRHYHDGGGAEQ